MADGSVGHNGSGPGRRRGRGRAVPGAQAIAWPGFSEADWLAMNQSFELSPQQLTILRLIVEHDMSTEALMVTVRTRTGRKSHKRSIEKQIVRIKLRLNELTGGAGFTPADRL